MIDEFNTSQTCTRADTDEKICLEKLKKYRSTRSEKKKKEEKNGKKEEKKITSRERKKKEKHNRKVKPTNLLPAF